MEQRFLDGLMQNLVDPNRSLHRIKWMDAGRFQHLISDFFALRGRILIRNPTALSDALQNLLRVVSLVMEDQYA